MLVSCEAFADKQCRLKNFIPGLILETCACRHHCRPGVGIFCDEKALIINTPGRESSSTRLSHVSAASSVAKPVRFLTAPRCVETAEQQGRIRVSQNERERTAGQGKVGCGEFHASLMWSMTRLTEKRRSNRTRNKIKLVALQRSPNRTYRVPLS